MRFRIDLKIFIFLIIFYFTKQIEIYAMIMLFALIHELGHLLADLYVKNGAYFFNIIQNKSRGI